MLGVIFNGLVNQAEQILEEEQACFRSQRSTTEHKTVGGKALGASEGTLS